jgi:ankyrin repeat protein
MDRKPMQIRGNMIDKEKCKKINCLLICLVLISFICTDVKSQKAPNITKVENDCDEQLYKLSPQMALLSAISDERTSCVKKFLQRGINPNFKVDNTYGTFPVLVALAKGNSDIIKELIKAGADIKGEEGKDALLIASSKGNLDIVKVFLENGSDINGKVKGKVAPLMAASYHGQKSILEYLLQSKADVNITSEEGVSSLMLVSDDYNLTQLLIKAGASIEATDNQGRTALFYAVINNQLEKVKALIENGSNVNIQDKKGITVLHLAEDIKDTKQKTKVMKLLKKFEP